VVVAKLVRRREGERSPEAIVPPRARSFHRERPCTGTNRPFRATQSIILCITSLNFHGG